MGLFDFMSKERRDQRAFDRHAGRVLRKTRAKDERMDESIHYLAELGTDEALFVLLKRYDVTIQSESMDRFEKELIHDLLVEKGARAIPPIVRYLQTSDAVTWPIQALRKITTDEKVVEAVLEVLDAEFDKDTFKPDKKARMLELLRDHDDERIAPVVVKGLKDFDETIRFGAVDCLLAQGDEVAREPLLALLTDEEEESQRIKQRIIEGFVETGWTVKGFRKAVEAMLPAEHWVDRQGRICRRGAR